MGRLGRPPPPSSLYEYTRDGALRRFEFPLFLGQADHAGAERQMMTSGAFVRPDIAPINTTAAAYTFWWPKSSAGFNPTHPAAGVAMQDGDRFEATLWWSFRAPSGLATLITGTSNHIAGIQLGETHLAMDDWRDNGGGNDRTGIIVGTRDTGDLFLVVKGVLSTSKDDLGIDYIENALCKTIVNLVYGTSLSVTVVVSGGGSTTRSYLHNTNDASGNARDLSRTFNTIGVGHGQTNHATNQIRYWGGWTRFRAGSTDPA